MPIADTRMRGKGALFLISAGFMAEMLAFFCSSPQTGEMQPERAATTMKWVKLGLVGGVAFCGVAAWLEPGDSAPIIAGGALMGAVAWGAYTHATAAGINGGETSTWKNS